MHIGLTSPPKNRPWDLVLSEDEAQQIESFDKLKELHLLGNIRYGDQISAVSGHFAKNLGRLNAMFPGEYQIIKHHDNQKLLRIAPQITTNICHEMPNSTKQLDELLSETGYVVIRTNQPLDEVQVMHLVGGQDGLVSYTHGMNKREQISNSLFSYVTPWSQESEILPHNELTHHTEFPKYLCFASKQHAPFGGETTLYDCEQAFANLSPDFQKKALAQNIVFTRRHSERQRKNTATTMARWRSVGYSCTQYEEQEGGEIVDIIETQLVRPIAYHYQDKICLHTSIVGAAAYWYKEVLKNERPQMTLAWENGEPLSDQQFLELEIATKAARIFYSGERQAGDLIILDNLRVSHGRQPFIGERKVGILMGGKMGFELSDTGWHVKAY